MAARTRRIDMAIRNADRQRRDLGSEFLERRLSLSLTQADVAAAAGMNRNRYASIEAGRLRTVTLEDLHRVGAVLGLDVSVRAYPGGAPIRDAGHGRKLARFISLVASPLRCRLEVGLPEASGHWERRAWDAVLYKDDERTAVEVEMRLRDVQAMRRRHELKRRDDPSEHFLLLIADTRHNRQVLAEYQELFADLPRLRPRVVRAALQAGQHPPTGIFLV